MEITAIQLLRTPSIAQTPTEGVLEGNSCTFRVDEIGLPEAFLETGPETVEFVFGAETVIRGYLVVRNRVEFQGQVYLSGEFVADA